MKSTAHRSSAPGTHWTKGPPPWRPEDLYYNTVYKDRLPFQLDRWRDNLKLGIYTKDPDPAELGRAFFHKIWITNSPEGWVPELYNRLENN